MDPKHLYYLSEIIRYGSLSRASERLGVVQPTLTRVVKILEDQAGAPLLLRGRYGVSPTEIGEQLAEAGAEIASQVVGATEAVEHWKAGLGRELRVGVGPMLALSIVPKFLAEYLKRKWPFSLKVTTATAGRLVERLNSNELDVVLAPSRLNMHQEKLVQDVIFEDRMAVYAGKRSPLIGLGRTVTSQELAQATWISVGARSNIYEAQRDTFDLLGIPHVLPRISFTGDIAMCLDLLGATDVLVSLPQRLTEFSGRVTPEQQLDVAVEMLPRDIAFWSTKENSHRPQVIQFRSAFSKWLNREFGMQSD